MKRKAFTLIELLVVIAIIAILAAILFPVFAKAREKARMSSCASNIKQLGLAVQQYQSDFDEMSPLAAYAVAGGVTYPNGSTGGTLLWYHLLMPYLKNVQILNCPSYPGTMYTGFYHPPGGLGGNQYGWGLALATYTKPAELGLIMDAGWDRTTQPDIGQAASRADGYYLLDWDIPSAIAGGDNSPAPNPRHNQMTNVAFLDGHVKAVATTNIINGDTTSTAPSALPVGNLRNFWDPAAP